MRFTVTPLGGARREADQVVGAIVRYLQPPTPATEPDGASRYYADGSDEPGRWLGRGARESGLQGRIHTNDFSAVLSGRNPHTGSRLITAQGSAGRRPSLGAGRHTARDLVSGRCLFDEADAAAALGLTRAEVSRMIEVGTRVVLSGVPIPGCVPGSVPATPPDLALGLFLVPCMDGSGRRWLTEAELDRFEDQRAHGTAAEAIAAAGDGDDQFPISEAARIAGVTAQYLRTLARRYESDRRSIDSALHAGRLPRQA